MSPTRRGRAVVFFSAVGVLLTDPDLSGSAQRPAILQNFLTNPPNTGSLPLVLTLVHPLEDREPGLLGIRGGEGLEVMRGAETGDHLADRLLAGRARGEFRRGDRAPEGELATAGGAVAVTQFVFVQRHESLVGNRKPLQWLGSPKELSPHDRPDPGNVTGFPPGAIVETA